jgi:hypothetical protein
VFFLDKVFCSLFMAVKRRTVLIASLASKTRRILVFDAQVVWAHRLQVLQFYHAMYGSTPFDTHTSSFYLQFQMTQF